MKGSKLTVVRSRELTFRDGGRRRAEMSEAPGMVVTYQAGEDGFREINVFPESHRPKTLSDFDTQLDPSMGITERPILVGALDW